MDMFTHTEAFVLHHDITTVVHNMDFGHSASAKNRYFRNNIIIKKKMFFTPNYRFIVAIYYKFINPSIRQL